MTIGGTLLYTLGDELFSTASPNNLMSTTTDRLRNVSSVTSLLGDDFTGAYDLDSQLYARRFARKVMHTFVDDPRFPGQKRLVMQWYLRAPEHGIGKVQCEMVPRSLEEGRNGDLGEWKYARLSVECHLNDGRTHKVNVV
ncbi:hypothetical protein BC828DRAFT_239409 [Blastocladiella britannica]|nr:hypothetical protein BC828DRAFT_239409 [Blastocladiella britannica]